MITNILLESDLLFAIAETDGFLRTVSPSWTHLLGWTESELLQRPFLEFIHDEDREKTRIAAEYSTTHHLSDFRTRCLKKDGTYVAIQWDSVVAINSQQVLVIARPIEDDPEELFRSHSSGRYRGTAIYTMTALRDQHGEVSDFVFRNINELGERLLNMSREEVLGKRLLQLFPSNVAPGFFDIYRKVAETQAPYSDVIDINDAGFKLTKIERLIIPSDDGITIRIRDASDYLTREENLRTDLVKINRERVRIDNERSFLSAILNGVADPIFVKDREHRWIAINESFCRFLGYNYEDLIGKSDFEFFPPSEASHFWELDEQVFKSHNTIASEEHLMDSSGKLRVISTVKSHFQRPDGAEYLVGTIRDVTDYKRIQEELRVSREETERANQELRVRLTTVEAAADMMLIVDAEGKISYANPAFYAAVYSTEFLEGTPFLGTFLQLDEETELNLWLQAKEGLVWNGEGLLQRSDGTSVPLELSFSPILDARGLLERMVVVGRDISVRRRIAELETTRETYARVIKALERVLGIVGHELRTPLAGLRITTDLLLSFLAEDNSEIQRFVSSMHDEVLRMTRMVNDLLEVARLNSGTVQWNWDDVDLVEVCSAAIATVTPLTENTCVDISLHSFEGEVWTRGDADALRRLVINLLSNAIKHTDAGLIELSVFQRGDDLIEIAVADPGRGVAPELADRLAQPFALNSGDLGDGYIKGSGLGLSICRGIVEAHGGRLFLESSGNGTTVRVLIDPTLQEPQRETVKESFFVSITDEKTSERNEPKAPNGEFNKTAIIN